MTYYHNLVTFKDFCSCSNFRFCIASSHLELNRTSFTIHKICDGYFSGSGSFRQSMKHFFNVLIISKTSD